MNKRENLLSLYRRTGYETAPVSFNLCPSLMEKFREVTGSSLRPDEYYGFSQRAVSDGKLRPEDLDTDKFRRYIPDLKPGSQIDIYGVGHEPGSAEAKHMTYMRNPLKDCETLDEMKAYPFPDYALADYSHQAAQVAEIHAKGLAAEGNMQCTVWESAWYMRGMLEMMEDMMDSDEKADFLLDRVADNACQRAAHYAKAGCDLLFLGDDIGMQRTIMMSMDMYRTFIKPRLKRVIDAARAEKPDIIVLYHSCGYVEPFIPELIDAGVDVLNPVQPECMDFKKIHDMYGDRLSFNGTIGTQSVMPFETPDGVRRKVFENLEIAGDKGGLLCCPTHLLEPEVPYENVEAYVKACMDFK